MSHGKRYTAKERKDILSYLENHTYQETIEKFGVSQMSLARWVKNKKKRETNTTPPLLNTESQNELQIYLKIVEKMDNVIATAIITAAGELILPENSGFHSIFSNVNHISVLTSKFLLCAQGFTSAVMNEQKNKDLQFDDISIKTPVGRFLMHSIGKKAVLVVLFNLEYDMGDSNKHGMYMIEKIREQILHVIK